MNSQRQLFLIGDNCNLVDRLGEMLTASSQLVSRFNSAEAFLENHTPEPSGCLLYVSCQQLGTPLELIKGMAQRGLRMPLILITPRGGNSDTVPRSAPIAQDFPIHRLEQPVSRQDVLQVIERIFHVDLQQVTRERHRAAIHARLCRLSSRHRSYSRLRIIGHLARQIAGQLVGNPVDAEQHRSPPRGHVAGEYLTPHSRQLGCPIDCFTTRPKLMVESDPVE